MAGGSVLNACLKSDFVEEVRVVTRRPMPGAGKMRVIVHQDYLDYAAITEAFQGIDLCLFCLGVSVHINTFETPGITN